MACGLSFIVKGKELFKVRGSHVHCKLIISQKQY